MKELFSRKKLQIILFLSLAANLFFAGFLVSRHMIDPAADKMRTPHGLSAYVRHLPREERRALFRDMKRDRAEFRQDHAKLAAIRQEIMEIMLSERVDRTRLDRILAGERQVHLRVMSRVQKALIEHLLAMPAERRREVMEQTRDSFRNRQHKRHRSKPGDPPRVSERDDERPEKTPDQKN